MNPSPGTPVRRSASRHDRYGARVELPEQSSLEVLPSAQASPASSTHSGGARPRTPAGSMAPGRRQSSAAAGGASTPPVVRTESSWSDRRCVSSRASVASGCPAAGDTFLTELHREFKRGALSPDGDGSFYTVDSRANPMQSPGVSACFSSYGAQEDGASDEDSEGRFVDCEAVSRSAESRLLGGCSAVSLLHSEATNPMMTPEGSALVGGGATGVLEVIQQLYGTECGTSSDEDQLRLEAGNVLQVAPHAECTPVGTLHEAPDAANQQQQQQQQAGCCPSEQEPPGVQQQSATPCSAGSRSEAAHELLLQDTALPPEDAPAQGGRTDQQLLPTPEPVSSEADTDTAEAPRASEVGITGQQWLQDLEARMGARPQLQHQLSEYVAGVCSKLGGDGQQLVQMPDGYPVLVEQMIRDARAQTQELFGWEGPRRYQDLPISHMPGGGAGDDPEVKAGLARIKELDQQLQDMDLKLIVAAREADPDKYAAQERMRLEQRGQQLQAALTAAREKRLHAAKLSSALQQLSKDSQEGLLLAQDSQQPTLASDAAFKYYILSAAEEQLLEAVMARDNQELFALCPFDATRTVLQVPADGLHRSSSGSTACATAPALSSASSHDMDAGHAQQQRRASSAVHGGGRAGSRPATPGSAISSIWGGSSLCIGGSSRQLTIADIDAQLEALHKGLGLGSDAASQTASLTPQGSSRLPVRPSKLRAGADGGGAASRAVQHRAAGQGVREPDTPSGASQASGGDSESRSDASTTKRDFIREQREAKELMQRLRDVDARIRDLKTAELPAALAPEQLQALLAACRAAQA